MNRVTECLSFFRCETAGLNEPYIDLELGAAPGSRADYSNQWVADGIALFNRTIEEAKPTTKADLAAVLFAFTGYLVFTPSSVSTTLASLMLLPVLVAINYSEEIVGSIPDCHAFIKTIFSKVIEELKLMTKAEMAILAFASIAYAVFTPSRTYTTIGLLALTSVLWVKDNARELFNGILECIDFIKSIDVKISKAELVIFASAFITYMVFAPSLKFTTISILLPSIILQMTEKDEMVIQAVAVYTALCVGFGAFVTDMSLFGELTLRVSFALIIYCALGIMPKVVPQILS